MPDHSLDLDGLVRALDAKRRAEVISWRELARQAGVSPSTLTRMQQGKGPDVETFSALIRWLDVPAEEFLPGREVQKEPNPTATLAALMRSKRVKQLSPEAHVALKAIIEAATQIIREPKK